MAKKRSKGPGGQAEFSGGGRRNSRDNNTGDLNVKFRFEDASGMSSTEHPVISAVTITIPTKAVVKLLRSGGLHLGVKYTTIDVPIESSDTMTVKWA